MKRIFLELTDYSIRAVNSSWWRQIMALFLKPGAPFEIRCWREETELIRQALAFGSLSQDRSTDYEVSVTGVLTDPMISALLNAGPPAGAEQMVRFFTISSGHIWSAHYGTQLVISGASEAELRSVEAVLSPLKEYFSCIEEDV